VQAEQKLGRKREVKKKRKKKNLSLKDSHSLSDGRKSSKKKTILKGLIAASVGSLGYLRLSSDSEDFDQES